MTKNNHLLIGAVAAKAGLSIDTIRYYEKLGLVAPALRRESGYRVYSPEVLNRLAFIKRAQLFGFSLEEIGQLLSLRTSDPSSCAHVPESIDKKLADLDRKLTELNQLRRELMQLRRQCQKALRAHQVCPVITAIAEEPEAKQKERRRPVK